MPKTLNHDSAKALLEANGWTATVGGKHSTKMEKSGCRPITIPRHSGKDFGPSLRGAILRQAELTGANADLKDEVETAEAPRAGRE